MKTRHRNIVRGLVGSRFQVVLWACLSASRSAYAEQPAAAAVPVTAPSNEAKTSSPPPVADTGVERDAIRELPQESKPSESVGKGAAGRPWAEGVSQERQLQARKLFDEGTQLLLQSLFSEAIKRYDRALAFWQHPAIHYNYAVALFTLDKPIETLDHLNAALKFGQGPLTSGEALQVRRYMTLVNQRLAKFEITCDQPGVAVTLNGKQLLVGPGTYRGIVIPDAYALDATKSGYIEDRRQVTLFPGKDNKLSVRLYTEAELTRYHRPWAFWWPVTLTAAGAAVALGGGAFLWGSASQYDSYDERIKNLCTAQGAAPGCDPNGGGRAAATLRSKLDKLDETRTRADSYRALGTGMLVGGSAVLLGGAILVFVNRSQPYRVTPQELDSGFVPPQVSVFPTWGDRTIGVAAHGVF